MDFGVFIFNTLVALGFIAAASFVLQCIAVFTNII